MIGLMFCGVEMLGKGGGGFTACVISSSLADRGRGTSANRKLVGAVEIRCDWFATHTILKENIEPVSEFPLNTAQKLKCRLFWDGIISTDRTKIFGAHKTNMAGYDL